MALIDLNLKQTLFFLFKGVLAKPIEPNPEEMNFSKPATAPQVQSVGAIDHDPTEFSPSPLAVPYDSGVEDYPDAGPMSRVSYYLFCLFLFMK